MGDPKAETGRNAGEGEAGLSNPRPEAGGGDRKAETGERKAESGAGRNDDSSEAPARRTRYSVFAERPCRRAMAIRCRWTGCRAMARSITPADFRGTPATSAR